MEQALSNALAVLKWDCDFMLLSALRRALLPKAIMVSGRAFEESLRYAHVVPFWRLFFAGVVVYDGFFLGTSIARGHPMPSSAAPKAAIKWPPQRARRTASNCIARSQNKNE